jgi:hypothetical protein
MGAHRLGAADRNEFFAFDGEALREFRAVAGGEDLAIDGDHIGRLSERCTGGGAQKRDDTEGSGSLAHDVLPSVAGHGGSVEFRFPRFNAISQGDAVGRRIGAEVSPQVRAHPDPLPAHGESELKSASIAFGGMKNKPVSAAHHSIHRRGFRQV